MSEKSLRVRFAPAPTGMMHLGNIRTALMNYLIAQKQQGTLILRIEDTDTERNFDPKAEKIIEDLTWLSLDYQEGPVKGGPHAPYFQSQRNDLYQKELEKFISHDKVYRCFCTTEELEKKRNRQIALKQPPRYDKTCLKLDKQASETKAQTIPFIWRMKLDQTQQLTITDLSHGKITFDLKNFSDFPITRQNGTVTFMFANFVDDVLMQVTCAIRGEDHLTNTAGQAALYTAMNYTIPTFWHLPILCNIEGKKLSKRDFGFSLRDLKIAGYLPQAIVNYLALIGASFKEEIMSMQELIQAIDFNAPSATGQIKYDVEKLRWVNHKWICKLPTETIAQLARPYLESVYPSVVTLSEAQLIVLVGHIQKEMITIQDSIKLLAFYFSDPIYDTAAVKELMSPEKITAARLILEAIADLPNAQQMLENAKDKAKTTNITTKELFSLLRYALMATPHGPSVHELIAIVGITTCQTRFKKLLSLL
jgi:nondiscriminating glutamyl-tRNA synthetase